ncbi:hypothetical protein QFC21_000185 [Naganishia friedmannii]|uniref:Uncharacterized protein n=1 Tax=Naganishia friedmannii TaxID=89922 RepID=A0ACC2WAT5_9TREE|nr:hypothetical protein QFC21_000185 [Naganishia friedmannii]
MRVRLLTTLCALAVGIAAAEEPEAQVEKHRYESDISKLRSIVIHSLYSQKDIFLRELLSNSQDALEKLRLTSLSEGSYINLDDWKGNITIEARKSGNGGQLIVRDTGIGMSKSELAKNLGTIAKSGTSEFLNKADDSSSAGVEGSNLIGQFGLGFYSTFLVSPSVKVSSIPPATTENPHPVQHTFESNASGDEFTIYVDPRGNSLLEQGPCGTEVVLDIEAGSGNEWVLDNKKLEELVEKHSQFSSNFPIYLRSSTVYDEASTDSEEEHLETWVKLNKKQPLWMKDPKSVTEQEYREFYAALDPAPDAKTAGWTHWKGDSGSGVSFRAMMYIPAKLPEDFWNKGPGVFRNIRLLVKRVFITDDLGDDYLPRWLSFLKIVVDADDLPLNVSRETLQSNKFLRQLKRILVRKAIDMFTRISKEEAEEWQKIQKTIGNAIRIGMVESDGKDRVKLAGLLRFASTREESVSLEDYVDNRRDGQQQIYFLAGVGESAESLARSPLIEKPVARGYEVLLLNAPADETVMAQLGSYRGLKLQDVAKAGFKYGDEDEDAQEKAELKMQNKAFRPLIEWLKKEFRGPISDDNYGWSANMQKLMMANAREDDPMLPMMKQMPKILEINPRSPLIEGLLERVHDLPQSDDVDEDDDADAVVMSEEEKELRETVQVLLDTAMIRSGFMVSDTNTYFDRVESLLRRSLGVSQNAKTRIDGVKPAPPVAQDTLPDAEEAAAATPGMGDIPGGVGFEMGADGPQFMDWQDLKSKVGTEKLLEDQEQSEDLVEALSHDEL